MGCNKIIFASRAEANEYARAFKRQGSGQAWHKLRGTWRAYPCHHPEHRGKFHLTTMSKAEEIQYRKRLKRLRKA